MAYGAAGLLADGIAAGMRVGVGRGAAAVIIGSGILLAAGAAVLHWVKTVRELEQDAEYLHT